MIVALLLAGGGWVAGQTTQVQPYRVPIDPTILSGVDIGFRVEDQTPGGVVGTLMVRLKNGEWVEAYGGDSSDS